MTAQHLPDLEPTRRYATLVAVMLEARVTVIDEIANRIDECRFLKSCTNATVALDVFWP